MKGKVLDSLAAGVPCVMTQVAAEGIPLSAELLPLVVTEAASMAALICRLHSDGESHRRYSDAGLAMIAGHYATAVVEHAMARVLGHDSQAQPMRSAAVG